MENFDSRVELLEPVSAVRSGARSISPHPHPARSKQARCVHEMRHQGM
jgi:hypothetical protein